MLNTVRVKICGIKSLEIARAAVDAGADALGFVFAKSRRQISPSKAQKIIMELPPFVSRVGVFVDTVPREVQEIVNYCGLDTIQLHGEAQPDFYRGIRCSIIKSFQVKGEASVRAALNCSADAYLFDTYKNGLAGGTGEVFDWDVLKIVNFQKPVILSGGLNADNVAQAIKTVKPYAVDVSSGVETNGVKDIEKIKAFITKAKGVLIK
ncbi:phosphoribosylanthranilate isomerase [Desulfolucanica intricata]|uniref:phosphoribosylanthranilate isomerase n=1 Tax=Desulfolucanica intricata TaxID=1285191 RepID=UPI000835CF34|nr:phosphoribosylanthranilate isomerase [Desulfolucanica intricata]